MQRRHHSSRDVQEPMMERPRLNASRIAEMLENPSQNLLIVLGQKYLAQLKKQAAIFHANAPSPMPLQRSLTSQAAQGGEFVNSDSLMSSHDAAAFVPAGAKRSQDAANLNDDQQEGGPPPAKRQQLAGQVTTAQLVPGAPGTAEDDRAGQLLLSFIQSVNRNGSNADVAMSDVRMDTAVASLRDTVGGGRRVLVADDSSSLRKFMKAQLESRGFVVETAENGQAALDKMKSTEYSVVFLDLEMPIMNGFTCSAAFREWERRTRVGALRQPICALSVHTGKQEKDMCAEAGVDFFEAKPARIPGLMKIAELCIKLQQK